MLFVSPGHGRLRTCDACTRFNLKRIHDDYTAVSNGLQPSWRTSAERNFAFRSCAHKSRTWNKAYLCPQLTCQQQTQYKNKQGNPEQVHSPYPLLLRKRHRGGSVAGSCTVRGCISQRSVGQPDTTLGRETKNRSAKSRKR